MTKNELAAKLAQDLEISKKRASTAIDVALSSIKDAVRAGDTVSFLGFGSFKMVERAAREGRRGPERSEWNPSRAPRPSGLEQGAE